MHPDTHIFLFFTLLIACTQASWFKFSARRTYQSLYHSPATPPSSPPLEEAENEHPMKRDTIAATSCYCGYKISDSNQKFTHHVALDPSLLTSTSTVPLSTELQNQGWSIQNYLLDSSPKDINYTPSNVQYNSKTHTLDLIVSGGSTSRSSINSAEISTNIESIKYGSFRFTAKTSTVPGACNGFFFYKDDQHEIDIEILTSYLSKGDVSKGQPAPGIQYTVQPLIDAQMAKNYKVWNPAGGSGKLPAAFHEYRFDWSGGLVNYFMDGKFTGVRYNKNVPGKEGSVIVNNWSNGDEFWSAGPPTANSVLQIKKIDLYFNVTSSSLMSTWSRRCQRSKTPVCKV